MNKSEPSHLLKVDIKNGINDILNKYEFLPISFNIIESIKKEIEFFLTENTSFISIGFHPTASDCHYLIVDVMFNDLSYNQYKFTFVNNVINGIKNE